MNDSPAILISFNIIQGRWTAVAAMGIEKKVSTKIADFQP